MAKQKRDSNYYLGRLEKNYPTHFADLKAGRYSSVREASIAAGLVKPPSGASALKRAWGMASDAERREFLKFVGFAPTPGSATTPKPAIHLGRRLQPCAVLRIKEILSKRRLSMGDLMDELGLKRLNPSVGQALSSGTRLQADTLKRLEQWLSANAAI